MTAVVVMVLGLVPVATNIYGIFQDTQGSCVSSKISSTDDQKLLFATRACVLISEFMVLVAAWRASLRSRALKKLVSKGGYDRISLIYLFFRDGVVHFALLFGMNVAGIIYFLQNSGTLSSEIQMISSVVLCRFFLNLRQAASSHDAPDEHSSRTFSGTTSRIVGDMGETLEECPWERSTPVDEYYDTEVDDLDARTAPDGGDEVDGSAVAESIVV